MPYILRKQKTRGYKVCKRGTRKCFSKRPLTKYMAKRQMRALYLHERVGAGTGGGDSGKSRRKRRYLKGGMFHMPVAAAAAAGAPVMPVLARGMMTPAQAAAAAAAAALVVAAAPPAVQLAVAQMPLAYTQFLRVSQNITMDSRGVPLAPVRIAEIQRVLEYPTQPLPPTPLYQSCTLGLQQQPVLEQQTFGCPMGDFIRFKRQMMEDEQRGHYITVKNYHRLQMSLLEHLCGVYDATTLDGIESIQNIGVEWKDHNQPE